MLSLFLLISTATTSLAAPTIGIEDTSPVEIVLTGGDTDFDYEGFADKLKAELVAAGVAEYRIKITASEMKNYSSVDDGLNIMKDTWTKVPTRADDAYIDRNSLLRGPNDGSYRFHGYINKEDKETNQYAMAQLTFAGWCSYCPAGVTSRIHKNDKGTYDMFFASLEGTSPMCQVRLYKVTNAPLEWGQQYDVSQKGFSQTSNAIRVASSNYFNSGFYDRYDSSKDDLPISNRIVLKMESKGDTHIISVDNQEVLRYTSPDIPVGSMAYGAAYPMHTGLAAAEFTIGAVTPLVDAVRSSDWAANSSRFIVDVCDTEREDFTNNEKVGELVQRMEANGAYYIGWGRTSVTGDNIPSKASMLNFIAHNSGRGKFFDNKTENQLYKRTAEYIKPIVCSRQDLSGRVYLYKDKEYSFN